MKTTSWFCKSNLFNLTLFLQIHQFLSLSDNHFGDCLSKKCGELDIIYPFHIRNQQKSYCGFPGFEVSCNNGGSPVMNISGNDYVIRNISYKTQKFVVVNPAFAIESNCFGSIKNLSLEWHMFQFAANHSEAYLFPNCSAKVVQEHKENRVKCGGIAVSGKDPKLKKVEKECNGAENIIVPYYDEGAKDASIEDSLGKGMVLHWKAHNCTACMESGGQCGFDTVNNQFNCFCPDRKHASYCPKKKNSLLFGTITAAIALCGAAVLIAVIIIYAKREETTKRFTNMWKKQARRNQNVEAFLKNYGSLAPKRYTNAEIKKMTNNFSEKLGVGGFGAVYKGQLQDSRFVAVKKLNKMKGDGDDFLNEVVSISRTNHVNIVSLLGFCFERNKRALVYEFTPNGSLEKFIDREARGEPLPSETLFGIALGIAKGLDYLHRGCNMRILHFDIKPHNVLLDEQLCPKISEFGLARLCPAKESSLSMTGARGTIGYIAPELFCRNFGSVSHKSDVYSYGIMLLDMVCGRKNVVFGPQKSSETYFPDWIYHQLELQEESEIHEIINNQEFELKRKMILVGLWCIQAYPSNRPAINRAIEMLEGPLDSLQVPPKPRLSSPPQIVLDSSGTQSVLNIGY